MKINPGALKLAEHVRAIHIVSPPQGTTLEDLLKPEAWAHVAHDLTAGSRVEVVPESGEWFAEFYVVEAKRQWAKVVLLRKVDLTAAPAHGEATPADAEDFYAKWSGPISKFRVHRKKDKEVIRADFATAEDANLWIADHKKSLAR